MSTETQPGTRGEQADGAGPRARSMLTVTDSRTGRTYELPITDGTVRAMDLRQIKVDDDDFGLMAYDPAYMNTASLPQLDHLHRRRRGHPAAPRLPDRAALRALQLPRGRLPADQRRAARPQPSSRSGSTRSRSTPSCTRTSRTSCRASATTPTRWACWSPRSARCRPSTPTPTRSTTRTIRGDPDHPPAREDADARGLRLPPQHGPALRLPRQRPQLRRQLPGDDVQNDRAQVRARSPPGARAGRPLHPARRPRTERLDERRPRRRLHPGRPLLGRRRRRRRALRPAARRRQRGGPADAQPDREGREHPRLPGGREGRARSA